MAIEAIMLPIIIITRCGILQGVVIMQGLLQRGIQQCIIHATLLLQGMVIPELHPVVITTAIFIVITTGTRVIMAMCMAEEQDLCMAHAIDSFHIVLFLSGLEAIRTIITMDFITVITEAIISQYFRHSAFS